MMGPQTRSKRTLVPATAARKRKMSSMREGLRRTAEWSKKKLVYGRKTRVKIAVFGKDAVLHGQTLTLDQLMEHDEHRTVSRKTTPSEARLEYFPQSARARSKHEVCSAHSLRPSEPLCFQDLRTSGTDLSRRVRSLRTTSERILNMVFSTQAPERDPRAGVQA